MRRNRNRSPRGLLLPLAILASLSCSGDRVVDVRGIITEYTIFEQSRVLWPLSYYSDSAQAHFLYTEYLTFDDTGRMLTRKSYILTRDLKTGTATNQTVTAHMAVQRKGNTLILGAPDACAPHADCTAGRVLRIPETGLLVEGAGRYGADSLVFGPQPAMLYNGQ